MDLDLFGEFISCQKDFAYYAGKYLRTRHPKKGLLPFSLYGYQKRLVETYESERFVLSKKFRQGGFTTVTALYALWECSFRTNIHYYFASKTSREAEHIGQVVKMAVRDLPDWLVPKVDGGDNKKEFWKTGSSMIFGTPETTIGKSFNRLVLDEAAFIPDMSDWWKALYPVLSGTKTSKAFVLSTINGVGTWFDKVWEDALKGGNKFVPFKASYSEHPDYADPAWVDEMRKRLGDHGFAQEILCEHVIRPTTTPPLTPPPALSGMADGDLFKLACRLTAGARNLTQEAVLELCRRVAERTPAQPSASP